MLIGTRHSKKAQDVCLVCAPAEIRLSATRRKQMCRNISWLHTRPGCAPVCWWDDIGVHSPFRTLISQLYPFAKNCFGVCWFMFLTVNEQLRCGLAKRRVMPRVRG